MYQLDMGIILDAMRDLQIQQKCQGGETDMLCSSYGVAGCGRADGDC